MNQFDDADWRALAPRLTAFACRVLKKHGRDVGPDGRTAIEYVTRSVSYILEHRRGSESLFRDIAVVIIDLVRRDL